MTVQRKPQPLWILSITRLQRRPERRVVLEQKKREDFFSLCGLVRMVSISATILLTWFSTEPSAAVPPDYPHPLNVGLIDSVGPTTDVASLVGPKTEPVNSNRYSRIHYVSASHGSDSVGIGSATSPFASIGFAVSQIESGTESDFFALFVSSGFYPTTSPIDIPERTHLYGGFDPGTWIRDIEEHQTILDGRREVRSILVASNETLFDGLILQKGHREMITPEDRGGAIFLVQSASATISNNLFRYNAANNGGGVFCHNDTTSVIRNNSFYGNSSRFGAAVYIGYRATPFIARNVIRDHTDEVGTIIRIGPDSHATVTQNIVSDNFGHGISCSADEAALTENIVTDNTGNGISFNSEVPSTVSHNLVCRNGGHGISTAQSAIGTISNNLVADNGVAGISGDFQSSTDIINNVVSGHSGTGIHGWRGVARNNVVVRNVSPFDGGGINWSDGTVANNLVASNHTNERGGGIHARFVLPVVISTNLVASNTCSWEGGGILCYESNLLNNIVYRNAAPNGAGIITESGPLLAFNNLVLGNAAQNRVGGILFGYNSRVSAANNLVYGNTAKGTPSQIVRESQEFSITNCLVQGGFEGEVILDTDPNLVGQLLAGGITNATYIADIAQTSILVSEPTLVPGSLDRRYIEIGFQGTAVVSNSTNVILVWGDFVDTATGSLTWRIPDFRLRPESPCIDAGLGPDSLSGVPIVDIDGDMRFGTTCDIGADEFNATYSLPTPLPTATPTLSHTPTSSPAKTETLTPTAALSPTQPTILEYDLYPAGGDGAIDARDVLEFLTALEEPSKSIFEYAVIWHGLNH